jgi:hypothetical protein
MRALTSRRALALALAIACASLAALAPAAGASFGLLPGSAGFDATLTQADGSPARVSGSHPHEMRVSVGFKTAGAFADGDLRDLHLSLPPGLLANSASLPVCEAADFYSPRVSPFQESLSGESCPDETQVGVLAVRSSYAGGSTRHFGLFNLAPSYGHPAAIGASPFGAPLIFTARIREGDAALTLDLENLTQAVDVQGLELALWGTPGGSPVEVQVNPKRSEQVFVHDNERGNCLNEVDPQAHFGQPGKIVREEVEPNNFETVYLPGTCSPEPSPLATPPPSYLSLPTSCQAPLSWELSARSWQSSEVVEATALSRDAKDDPVTPSQCVEFRSSAKMQLRTGLAASATGLVFNLDVNDGGGLLNEEGRITSPIERAVAKLPEGLTINPSVGSGLGVCTAADFARESADSLPGAGCPNASKIGEVTIEGLLGLGGQAQGSVFLAQPYENPFGSLLALYITAADPARGLFVKSVGKIEPDPHTGRLLAVFEDLPVLHYTHFSLSLREGQRAALISPPTCGAHETRLELNPWSDPSVVLEEKSALLIDRGEGGGPCPGSGPRPFAPRLEAGSLNAAAGAYGAFFLHMTRTDTDQEITSYSATFPPGLLAKIAGVATCPEAALAAAKARSGRDELIAPSCPASSKVGHTLAGYGVGGVLAYAPGGLYLAGPYHGAPLSLVAIDSALVGPFDLGVVIVRSAIRIDPRSGQASIDSAGSDPIPHILAGIPLHLRDIRVYVDRPNFTINPTSCDTLRSQSTLTGAGADPFNSADDVAAITQDRFQLLSCLDLGFGPKFSLALGGSTKHGGYPSLRATYRPRPGEANLKSAAVTLPHSIFLAQEHIRTLCTNKQFAAGTCPPGSVYGKARALTPLMDEPMEGPVYLRSSTNPLPDLVASLHGRGIAIEVVGRIDSSGGGLRGTFTGLPDAPVTSFTMTLPGKKRGLLVNAENLCRKAPRVDARFVAHSNGTAVLRPKLGLKCKGGKAKKGKR